MSWHWHMALWRLRRTRLYRATLYHLPLGRYRCSVCNRLITDRTCDRNLIADWPHCDKCMAELVATMDEGR